MFEKKFFCKLCGYTGKHYQSMTQHNKTKKHIRNMELQKNLSNYFCITPSCCLNNSDFDLKQNEIQCINNTIGPVNPKQILLNPKIDKKQFQCDNCSKVFTTNSNLIRHIKKKFV